MKRDQGRNVRTSQAADFLGLARATLERWRYDRPDGPRFLKLGRVVVYDLEDLHRWATQHAVPATSGEKAERHGLTIGPDGGAVRDRRRQRERRPRESRTGVRR
jgi:predicted DNA-binding transcriptional regulator AlpA